MTKKSISSLDLKSAAAALTRLAIKELFPEVILGESRVTSAGFYCDIISSFSFTSDFLQKIEERILEAIREEKSISFKEMTPFSAKEYFLFHQEPLLARFAEESEESTLFFLEIEGKMFLIEDFVQIKNSKEIGAIKLLKSEVLDGFQKKTRIHGLAFFNKQEKKEFFKQYQDLIGLSHVNLGKEKNWFEESEDGEWVWLPKGQKIKTLLLEKLEGFFEEKEILSVSTVSVLNTLVWKEIFLNHRKIFDKTGKKPSRFCISEWVNICGLDDKVFSSGLLDVKIFQTNISHLFCRKDLLLQELISSLHFMTKIFKILDFAFQIVLVGKQKSEEGVGLLEALQASGLEFFKEIRGKGPVRIEWRVQDRMGLCWPVSCLYSPKKMGEYAFFPVSWILSLERLMALLVERTQGKLPIELVPCQVKIVPLHQEHKGYAREVAYELKKQRVRVEVDEEEGELKPRLRKAFAEDVPFVVAIGNKEIENKKVTLRAIGVEPRSVSLQELIDMLNQ